jgi:pimeloyl-ACP methyl ester carboxylesterase
MMLYSAMLSKVFRAIYGPLPEEPEEPTGLVVLADGVGGLNLCGTGLKYAAAAQGLKHEIRVHCWGHGFGRWHADLTNVTNHEAKAELVASEVAEYRSAHPDAPVFLVGKSGGTGIVVKALERLPENAVELAVLLSPALSPQYDLSRSLQAVRREMVVFWSPLDVIVLGLGTQIFGTVDRINAASAGLVGFRRPESADPAQYAKLRQVRWRAEMAPTGYLGGHVGPDSPAFLRKYVVPLLQAAPQTAAELPPVSSSARPTPIT